MSGVKRYPIRGLFAGLLAGLGVAVLLILNSVVTMGTMTPYIIIVVFVILGVLWAMFGPVRQRKGDPAPARAGGPTSGAGPMPDAAGWYSFPGLAERYRKYGWYWIPEIRPEPTPAPTPTIGIE